MANEIVWYDSSETGAPTLNNAAGSLDAVLYACLVTGFRTITLDSITVSSNVATATFSGGHGYGNKRMVEISGATPSGLNGRKLITVTGAGTFTFPTSGIADGAASGTITAKRSPLGWTRPLNSGNVSIYERSDVTATAMKLRIDDSGTGLATATSARARMIESYTDLSTFVGPAPTDSQVSGGYHWLKGANSTGAKPWVLVGDSKTLYLFLDSSAYASTGYSGVPQGIFMFGDVASYRAGDAYGCAISGSTSATQIGSSAFPYLESLGSNPTSGRVHLSRPFNGIGGSVLAGAVGIAQARRAGNSGPAYPSPVNNGLHIHSPLHMSEVSSAFSGPLRGKVRGMGDPLATIPGGALHLVTLPNLGGSGRDWLLVGFQHDGGYGHAAFDITGPWD